MDGFWEDFGRTIQRFFRFFLKMPILQNIAFFLEKNTKIKGSILKTSTRNMEKKMKNRCKFGSLKKTSTYRAKVGFGRVLGVIWERFGTILGLSGRSWPLLGRFSAFKVEFFSQAWAQDKIQEAFWIDFGFWVDMERDLGGFWVDLGRSG